MTTTTNETPTPDHITAPIQGTLEAIIDLNHGSTVRTDDQGTYTVYHRSCKSRDCRADLTSRNCAGASLLCLECSLAKDQAKQSPTALTPREKATVKANRMNPQRIKAHGLLDAVLNHPTNEYLKRDLQSFLMTLEIKARM